jgi:hypothetical protein
LDLNVLVVKVPLEYLEALVVKTVELGLKVGSTKYSFYLFQRVDNVDGGFGKHWNGVDGVAAIIVENENDIVSSVGGNGETPRLVRVN